MSGTILPHFVSLIASNTCWVSIVLRKSGRRRERLKGRERERKNHKESGFKNKSDDGKVLELNNGDGCTTLWMYLMALNYTFKMVKIVNFISILPRFKKMASRGVICILTTKGTKEREGYRYPEFSLRSIPTPRKRWPPALYWSQPVDSDASGRSPWVSSARWAPTDICSTGTTVVSVLALGVLTMIAEWTWATRSGNIEKAWFITHKY